jgi:hypothetical protein
MHDHDALSDSPRLCSRDRQAFKMLQQCINWHKGTDMLLPEVLRASVALEPPADAAAERRGCTKKTQLLSLVGWRPLSRDSTGRRGYPPQA